MKAITVFCGSSFGNEEIFEISASRVGKTFAQRNIGLVYGGAQVGLMGAIADAAIANNGRVIGVLPHFLKTKEIAHSGLTELILVDSMHERKRKMNELSDGVIALPGGFGTLEELFEMLTWGQLGLHSKPIGLLNIDGFYNDLIGMIDHMVQKGFLKDINRKMLLVSKDIVDLLEKMEKYIAPEVPKWLDKDTS